MKKTPEKGRARFLIIETLKNSGILQPNEVALNSITIANQLIKKGNPLGDLEAAIDPLIEDGVLFRPGKRSPLFALTGKGYRTLL
ncbi:MULTISPECIES: hypothetical protein [Brucella]|uniref:hypothetical protein n=1 Tax=Brucella TaxID=234 RepID=UPI00045230AF|nr:MULTISPECIES: hypothetical protein [Brucella/Ochrobactrum group]MCR5944060.1 hypothetical protein [Ochrobactrum sp. XJ1]EXL03169.1 hypothetical protein BG46_05370 [Brucella anthropi]KIU65211.1 hypothetical protein TR92_21035 [Brucella anthropi]MBA8862304.1 hypothetical protein [Brucella anthropi]MDG9793152.1 hypothetical protein [Brucella anthropi]